MTPVLGREAARKICEALGIAAKGVRRIEVMADYEGVAIVRVDMLLYEDQLRGLVTTLREYRLEPQ